MYRQDFPILNQKDPLIYLDSGATTQKPWQVIQAVSDYYETSNANPHRGSYDLSIKATFLLDEVRAKTKRFINSPQNGEVIFTKNATEGLNLVAMSYGMSQIQEGDEILVSVMEHHSNLVPWQMVAKAKRATLTYLYPNDKGVLDLQEVASKLHRNTKILAIGHVSNVTGIINPIGEIIEIAHANHTIVVVDGTQGVPHLKVDLKELNPDFYVFSPHKMLAPMGIGIVYGKKDLLDEMPPFLYGGDMIEYVEEQDTTFAEVPEKFEAGTHNMGSVAGLGAAIDYLEQIGMEPIRQMEEVLAEYLFENLVKVPHLKLIGESPLEHRIAVAPFTLEGVHPHDVATILNQDHVAVRSGNHCAQPFHQFLKVGATCRASLYLYNSKEDIDQLCSSLKKVRRWLGYGT